MSNSNKKNNENQSTNQLIDFKKTILALIVSVLILAYYFYDQNWSAIFAATQHANIPLATAVFFFMVIAQWLIEVYLRGKHFTWFYGPFPWKDYFWMRGALFLVVIINGPLSGAARVLYLVKKTGISWTLYFGLGLFRLVLLGGIIAILMLLVTYPMLQENLFKESNISLFYWSLFIAWNLFVLLDVYLAFFHKKYIGFSRLIKNKVDHEFFKGFKQATHFQWLWTLCVGALPFLVLIICFWLMADAFGIHIPFWYFSISIVFVLILSNLPLTFGGFGTTTMAWLLFYKDFADESLLLSFTLFLPLARMVVYGVLGLVCLKPALNDFLVLLAEAKQSNAQKEKAKQDIRSIFTK